MDINAVEYDPCRLWIKNKRSKGNSWGQIALGCKKTEEMLDDFLKNQIEDNDWPENLDTEVWKNMVKCMQGLEEKKLNLQKESRMAELYDGKNQNNQITEPMGENTSWQVYKKHLKTGKHFSDEAIENITDATLGILKRLSLDTVDIGPVKGLVIGNVQSGKTANIAGLMAMAADWHWNMFIVLSGTIENLRKQTQTRLYNDLSSEEGTLAWIQFDHLSKKHSPVGQRLRDLKLKETSHMRYMTVCLKVKSRLEDLIDWIEDDPASMQNLRVLVIDDEADQAGVNTGNVFSDKERKTINRLILNLVHCRDKKAINEESNKCRYSYQAMNYISYTATPYANCLNETGKDTLYPKDFIRTLINSKSYFGPDKFFERHDYDNMNHLDIVRTVSENDVLKIKEIEKDNSFDIPKGLEDSLLWFICASAVMRYKGYKKPVSMLIHTSQKNTAHEQIAKAVENWFKREHTNLVVKCKNLYEQEKKLFTKEEFRKVYPDYEREDSDIWDYPDFEELTVYIKQLVERISPIMMDDEGNFEYTKGIHLCIDNCSNTGVTDDGIHMRLAYPKDDDNRKPDYATAFIIIGGNTLSRGLTLEGLVSTFFLRTVKQADTLMQMGRWFGYRPHYELLQRVWLTKDTVEKFEYLTEIDWDLRDQIYQMQLAGKSPEDFNLALLTSPKVSWLALTSKNKMQMSTKAAVDFSGMDTQLTVYSKDPNTQLKNLSIAEEFINSLDSGRRASGVEAFVWENIPFAHIRKNFFDKGFDIPDTSRSFQQLDILAQWINEQTVNQSMDDWTVIIMGKKCNNLPKEKIWMPRNDVRVGKITRSCKSETGDQVNIGVLSGKRDYLADITEDMVGSERWKTITSAANYNDYQQYRKEAGKDKTPLFVIYCIDKDSQPPKSGNNTSGRTPLNVEHDLIGVTMVVPGIRGNRACDRVKIKRMVNDETEEGL